MARRTIIVAVTAVVFAAWAASAFAATPASAPQRTSTLYALPVTLHWTPAPDVLNTSQAVMQSSGACATPVAQGDLVATGLDNTTSSYSSGTLPDGTYCFSIKTTDLAGATADSPGLTVVIDTVSPTTTVLVAGKATGGPVAGVVPVAATSADALSGVASSAVHVGAVGACPAGAVLGSTWDTTAYANGAYDVCSVATDNAGHSATSTVTVTVANARAPAPASLAAAPVAKARDKHAPRPPTKLRVVALRAQRGTFLVPFTLHWAKPAAKDLDRVVVVLNLKRSPRNPADGRVLNRGLREAAGFKLRSRAKAHIALYAYDHSGNVSRPARRIISLASLIPLRPLSGTIVRRSARLTWRPRKGSVYYNIQLFRNGRRVRVLWPSRASILLPVRKLRPGTYVWFVWPAVRHKGSSPTFGKLIGRSTFVYRDKSGKQVGKHTRAR